MPLTDIILRSLKPRDKHHNNELPSILNWLNFERCRVLSKERQLFFGSGERLEPVNHL